MLPLLLNLVIFLVVAVVVFMAAKYILDQAELDPPLRKIILLILGLVFLVWLVNIISGGALWPNVVVVNRA